MAGGAASLLAAVALLWLVAAGQLADEQVCRADDGTCVEGGGVGGYFWPKRGGNAMSNSFTPHAGPTDLSAAPAWTWPNADEELFRHGPCIDEEGSIYIVTSRGWVRKFSRGGQLLWSWETSYVEGRIVTSLALYNGTVYFASTGVMFLGPQSLRMIGGYAFALSMQTGAVIWRVELPEHYQEADSHTVFVADGVLAMAMRDRVVHPASEGQNKVVAMRTSDGRHLWDYDIDGTVWNFMPASPGDGSLIFATTCGRAHRLRLQTGEPLWKAALPEPAEMSCGTGGGTLGPDGRFYVATNHFTFEEGAGAPLEGIPACVVRKPEDPLELARLASPGLKTPGCPEGPGLYLVYRVEDGTIEQKRRMPLLLNQYPAVGTLHGKLAVVLGMGINPGLIPKLFEFIPRFLPWPLKGNHLVLVLFFQLQFMFSWFRRLLGLPVLANNTVAAFDAETGAQLWSLREDPWDHFAAAGDEEKFIARAVAFLGGDTKQETICSPDAWAIPVIAGDGTVYAGSGVTGNLYAIRDRDRDGQLEHDEVSTFAAGQAFLNGPALAPGLLAAAPCWGPMRVWTDSRTHL